MPLNERPERFGAAIAGASFAGLAFACALDQALQGDVRIALIDPAVGPDPATAPDCRASAISAGSKAMLKVLGVWPAIANEAQPVTGIEITDSSLEAGVPPVLLTYDNLTAAGEPATYVVPNRVLHRALADAAARCGAVSLLSPAEALRLEMKEADAHLCLKDGRELTASLIVAADGARSPLREAAGIKTVGWSYPQTGIVTTVRHERPHSDRAVQHFLPAGPFAILPLTGNRACITWTEDAREAARILALDDAGFLAEIDKRFGGKLGAVTLDGPRQSWPVELHLARRYVAPRFALVGDAAHGVHPLAGQGLNLAFRDVAALVEVVTEGMRAGFPAGDAQSLARYERWRRFDSAVS